LGIIYPNHSLSSLYHFWMSASIVDWIDQTDRNHGNELSG
jgi:hypothetical protein